MFLVVFETSGNGSEVVVHWEQTDAQSIHSKGSIIKGSSKYVLQGGFWLLPFDSFLFLSVCVGQDAAFIGVSENQYAILDDDKTGLTLYFLQTSRSAPQGSMTNGSLDPESFSENNVAPNRGAMQFTFESEVDRIFSTPLGM